MRDYWLQYLGHKQVFGFTVPFRRVLDGIREFDVYNLLETFGKLDSLLDRSRFEHSEALQQFLLDSFLSPRQRRAASRVAARSRQEFPGSHAPWLLSAQLIWVAAKVALQFATPFATRQVSRPTDRWYLGRMLLGLADYLELEDVAGARIEEKPAKCPFSGSLRRISGVFLGLSETARDV